MIIFWGVLGGNTGAYTDPGEVNVKYGVTYYFDGVLKTGTYAPTFSNQTNASFVGLPQVSAGMLNWFQPMDFGLITKTVDNYQNHESVELIHFRGVWQPFTANQMQMKPIGQRSWSWFMLHSDPSLILKNDDVIEYLGIQYRVMENNDYTKYGYFEYHLVEDFIGSGPTP
jgi:hypothetical protein